MQRWILARLRHRQFFSLEELNAAIRALLVELNHRPFKKLEGSRQSAFETVIGTLDHAIGQRTRAHERVAVILDDLVRSDRVMRAFDDEDIPRYAAAYWATEDLRSFMGVVSVPTHRQVGIALQ